MPLVAWPKPVIEYAGWIATYATIGAVAFRYGVLDVASRAETVRAVRDDAASRAAVVGAVGCVLGAVYLWLAAIGGKKAHAIAIVPLALVIAGGIAFTLAARRVRFAWPVAALITLVFAVRSINVLKWTSAVNPLHIVGGALWLGTLFVLAAAALPAALHARMPAEQRGPAVAWLVRAFSPVALAGASLLALTGVITAVRHVKYLSAMWTTPYGFALDLKLAVVAAVAGLGFWNWRRVKPRLGDEVAARELHTNARYELAIAAVVLVITSVLVSLPSPKLPHALP